MPIVRPLRPWAARLAHSSSAIMLSDSRSSGGIVDVVVERPLARLGDDLARGADDAVVLEARAAAQLEPEVRAEALDEHALGRGADGRERGQPQLGQARGGLRPDPRHQPGREPARSARTPARE